MNIPVYVTPYVFIKAKWKCTCAPSSIYKFGIMDPCFSNLQYKKEPTPMPIPHHEKYITIYVSIHLNFLMFHLTFMNLGWLVECLQLFCTSSAHEWIRPFHECFHHNQNTSNMFTGTMGSFPCGTFTVRVDHLTIPSTEPQS